MTARRRQLVVTLAALTAFASVTPIALWRRWRRAPRTVRRTAPTPVGPMADHRRRGPRIEPLTDGDIHGPHDLAG